LLNPKRNKENSRLQTKQRKTNTKLILGFHIFKEKCETENCFFVDKGKEFYKLLDFELIEESIY